MTKILSGAFIEMRELLPDNLIQSHADNLMTATDPGRVYPFTSGSQTTAARGTNYTLTGMLRGVVPNGSRISRKASPRPSGVPAANCRAEASKFKGDGWRAYDATVCQKHGGKGLRAILVSGGRRIARQFMQHIGLLCTI